MKSSLRDKSAPGSYADRALSAPSARRSPRPIRVPSNTRPIAIARPRQTPPHHHQQQQPPPSSQAEAAAPVLGTSPDESGKESPPAASSENTNAAAIVSATTITAPGDFRASPTSSPLRYSSSPPAFSSFSTARSMTDGPGGDWSPEELAWMRDAELNVLMPDTELCNPGQPPVRAVGIVIASYNFLQHHIMRRNEWVIRRSRDEYTEEGRRFWTEKAGGADRYFEETARQLAPAEAALQLRQFLDRCWATIPRLSILIDDIHSDGTLLNQLLSDHGHRALNYDASGNYRRTIYVSRDLMRGAFSMLQSNFVDLHCSDLYLAIHRYWQQLVGLQLQPQVPAGWAPLWASASEQDGRRLRKAAPPPASAPASQAAQSASPEIKHLPVWDAIQTLIVFFRMEDIKRWFHSQLAKLMSVFPTALVLPKSGSLHS